MAVQDVTVVSIPVSDQERAKAFYVDTLGLELVRDDDSVPGIRWVQVAPKAGTTALTLVTWFDSMPPGSLLGWASEAVLRDPDGNRLVLQQA
jgi:catechol 2,3-dioxygenase-like lactoylglutathione lyase family enzyme